MCYVGPARGIFAGTNDACMQQQRLRTSRPRAGSPLMSPVLVLLGICQPLAPLPSLLQPPPLAGATNLGSGGGADALLSGSAGAARLRGSARAAAAVAAGLSLLKQRGEPGAVLVGEPAPDDIADAAGVAWSLGGGGLVRMTGITRPGCSWLPPILPPRCASLPCRWGRADPSSRRLVRRRQASVALIATYTAGRAGARGEHSAVTWRSWLQTPVPTSLCAPTGHCNWRWVRIQHCRPGGCCSGQGPAGGPAGDGAGAGRQAHSLMRAPEAIAPDTSAATNRQKASAASTDPRNTPAPPAAAQHSTAAVPQHSTGSGT